MSYIEAINRALDFIEENLKSPIQVEHIAASARYSKFHFQRLFSIVTGETVGAYLRRRRLTEASRQLVESDRSILDIALDYQFNSQESFSRSFKDFFGETPNHHRKQNTPFSQAIKKIQKTAIVSSDIDRVSRQPEFMTRAVTPLIGLSYFGNNQDEIIDMWRKLEQKQMVIKNFIDPTEQFGLIYYDDNFFQSGEFSYMAAFLLKESSAIDIESIPIDFSIRVLPACEYAVFSHHGPAAQIPVSYEYIYGSWIPDSGKSPVAPYDFEFYNAKYNTGDPSHLELKIYIPVKHTEPLQK